MTDIQIFKRLKEHIIRFLFLFLVILCYGQNTSTRWTDYFSYRNVSNILDINGYVFASAENGLFIYDPNTQETDKISKVNDLNDVDITAFSYSTDYDMLMIGYKRGELDFLGAEDSHNQLEIPLHQFYNGDKRVNHIFPYQNFVVISGEFGLATFSLEDFEFMETVYFTQSSIYFGVKETIILNDVIYAASDRGIFYHQLDGFINNFVMWEQPDGVPNSEFKHIVDFQGNILASTESAVYRFDGDDWTLFANFSDIRDLTVNGNVFSITLPESVRNYDENLDFMETVSFSEELNTGIKIGNLTYGGSLEHGVIQGQNIIYPDGPYSNNSWGITIFENQIWISPGGAMNFNEVLNNSDGFSHFNGEKWIHYPNSELLYFKDIVDIEVNKNDPTEFYISSWNENGRLPDGSMQIKVGAIRFKNGQMAEHYVEETTGPNGLQYRERIGGSVMDDEGNLYIGQSHVDAPGGKAFIAKKTPGGSWSNINLNSSFGDPGARKPFYYNGYIFMALPRGGGLKMTDMENVYTVDNSPNRGNLPSDQIISAAIDLDGVLWIGTLIGLRVLYNPIESIISESYQAQPIIIEQGGIPEALLTDIQVNHIEVDGANQKWVATESSGVYYFSYDGLETIYHFTAENSPLPSNKVNFIKANPLTGEVFFATDKGVVSFRSDAVEVGESFGDVYSYPNPVRPGFSGDVVIKGLPNNADVKIVDVVGNLIYQTKASGGTAKWDTKNMKGKPVASGIYLVLMTNRDASETKQTKIAIVR